jgi:hypothetical protein
MQKRIYVIDGDRGMWQALQVQGVPIVASWIEDNGGPADNFSEIANASAHILWTNGSWAAPREEHVLVAFGASVASGRPVFVIRSDISYIRNLSDRNKNVIIYDSKKIRDPSRGAFWSYEDMTQTISLPRAIELALSVGD